MFEQSTKPRELIQILTPRQRKVEEGLVEEDYCDSPSLKWKVSAASTTTDSEMMSSRKSSYQGQEEEEGKKCQQYQVEYCCQFGQNCSQYHVNQSMKPTASAILQNYPEIVILTPVRKMPSFIQ